MSTYKDKRHSRFCVCLLVAFICLFLACLFVCLLHMLLLVVIQSDCWLCLKNVFEFVTRKAQRKLFCRDNVFHFRDWRNWTRNLGGIFWEIRYRTKSFGEMGREKLDEKLLRLFLETTRSLPLPVPEQAKVCLFVCLPPFVLLVFPVIEFDSLLAPHFCFPSKYILRPHVRLLPS